MNHMGLSFEPCFGEVAFIFDFLEMHFPNPGNVGIIIPHISPYL